MSQHFTRAPDVWLADLRKTKSHYGRGSPDFYFLLLFPSCEDDTTIRPKMDGYSNDRLLV